MLIRARRFKEAGALLDQLVDDLQAMMDDGRPLQLWERWGLVKWVEALVSMNKQTGDETRAKKLGILLESIPATDPEAGALPAGDDGHGPRDDWPRGRGRRAEPF
jgi:hypothetical protein